MEVGSSDVPNDFGSSCGPETSDITSNSMQIEQMDTVVGHSQASSDASIRGPPSVSLAKSKGPGFEFWQGWHFFHAACT